MPINIEEAYRTPSWLVFPRNNNPMLSMFYDLCSMTSGERRNQRLSRIQWKWRHKVSKLMGHNQSSAQWKVHRSLSIQKIGEISHY